MMGKLLDSIKVWHIVAASAMACVLGLTAGLSLNGDDSLYILISRSFVSNGFFHEIFVSDALARSSYYYFMLPLILAPFAIVAPSNYLAMKAVPLIAAIGAVALLAALLKGLVGERHRKIILILFAFNPWLVEYSGLILTDMPYLFFMLASLVLFRAYDENRRLAPLIASVILAGAAFYTRPAGVALCFALAAYCALKRRARDIVIILAVLMVVAVPVLVHVNTTASVFISSFIKKADYFAHDTGGAQKRDIIRGMGRNALVYAGSYLPDIVARPAVSGVAVRRADGAFRPLFMLKCALGALLSSLVLAGFFATARSRFGPWHIYAVMNFLMNLVINVYVARYLVSMLPFILYFLVAGVAAVNKRLFRGRAWLPAAAFSVLIALSFAGAAEAVSRARSGWMSAEARSFVECNDWIKANAASDAVILSRKASYTKLYTGRAAIPYIISDDADLQLRNIADSGVRFVIIGDLGSYLNEEAQLARTVRKFPADFRLRYTTGNRPENYVYEFIGKARRDE